MKSLVKLSLALLFVLATASAYAQCEDASSKHCSKAPLGEYDYVGQSTFKLLSSGDVLNVNTVFYANYNYRVIVCNDATLNPINFQIIERVSENVDGKIVTGEKILYNSADALTNEYFEIKGLKQSKRAIIRITVSEKQSPITNKCVNILIGSHYSRSKGYRTPGSGM